MTAPAVLGRVQDKDDVPQTEDVQTRSPLAPAPLPPLSPAHVLEGPQECILPPPAPAVLPAERSVEAAAAADGEDLGRRPEPAADVEADEFEMASETPTAMADAIEEQARLVRQHEDEVIMQHFHAWIVVFSIVVCLATPAMITLLVGLILATIKYRHVDCDVPLRLWVYVTVSVVVFNSTVNRPTPQGSWVQRFMCLYTRDQNQPRPMPWRVRLWNLSVTIFVFTWNCLGLHWVTVDGSFSAVADELAPCEEVAPTLWLAVKVYAAFNLAITLFMYVNMLGFSQLLRIALRRGLLRTSQAAPDGSLEKNTEAATMDDPVFAEDGDHKTCSICLEDFSAETPFLRTRACDHYFHRQCLKGWLQVRRSCPLCRKDLGIPAPGERAIV